MQREQIVFRIREDSVKIANQELGDYIRNEFGRSATYQVKWNFEAKGILRAIAEVTYVR